MDKILLIYGQTSWALFDTTGKQLEKKKTFREDPILSIVMESKENFSVVHWSGDMQHPEMALETFKV